MGDVGRGFEVLRICGVIMITYDVDARSFTVDDPPMTCYLERVPEGDTTDGCSLCELYKSTGRCTMNMFGESCSSIIRKLGCDEPSLQYYYTFQNNIKPALEFTGTEFEKEIIETIL